MQDPTEKHFGEVGIMNKLLLLLLSVLSGLGDLNQPKTLVYVGTDPSQREYSIYVDLNSSEISTTAGSFVSDNNSYFDLVWFKTELSKHVPLESGEQNIN